jgi:hypothetical protein
VSQQWIIRRRRLGEADIELIRGLIREEGQRGRTHLSERLCRIWDWRQANGHWREIACRDLLRQLEAKGLVQLPPAHHRTRQIGYEHRIGRRNRFCREAVAGSLVSLKRELQVRFVQEPSEADVFKELVGVYHYLGGRPATGAQVRYLAWYRDGPVAGVRFGPAAWRVAARDQFIGGSASQRHARLPWVVNNDRFVIPPWVQVPGLASWGLSRCLRRLAADWQQVYRQELALAETFIERDRFTGRSYAAANWQRVGESVGRGRNDRFHQEALPIKTIWVYPLRPDFRLILCPTR